MHRLTPAPPPPLLPAPAARALARLLCAWLIGVLLLQGLAAGAALARGPLHRHRPAPAALSLAATPLLTHDAAARPALHAHLHLHLHLDGRRHLHMASDPTLVMLDDERAALNAQHAGQLLADAYAATLPAAALAWAAAGRPVQQAAATWWASSRGTTPPLRPPRG